MALKPEAGIYTDGSCLGNPGPGGWASVVIVNGQEQRFSGGAPETTNNRMELMGVINAINALKGPHIVTIYSDSQYVVNAFNQNWLRSWKQKGWQRADGPLKNKDLWQVLDKAVSRHSIKWVWVKGHAGNRYNEICDQLAVAEANKYLKDPAHLSFLGNPPEEPDTSSAAPDVDGEYDYGEDAVFEQTEIPAVEDEPALCDQQEEMRALNRGEDQYSAQALICLDTLLLSTQMKEFGMAMPCGACDYCDMCPGSTDHVRYRCAKAYIDYTMAKNEENADDGAV